MQIITTYENKHPISNRLAGSKTSKKKAEQARVFIKLVGRQVSLPRIIKVNMTETLTTGLDKPDNNEKVQTPDRIIISITYFPNFS